MDGQRSSRPVVVGVDGSTGSEQAVRWAAAEAVRRRAPLAVVTAFPWEVGEGPHPLHGSGFREEMLAGARRSLAAAAELAAEQVGGELVADLEVRSELVTGHPVAVLGAQAAHAQLLVVGNRGMGGIAGLLVGSVAVALAAGASCPVVVVRGEERAVDDAALLPVVLGVDGTPTSESAIGFAFDAAADRGADLVAVHSWWDWVTESVLSPLLDADAEAEQEAELLGERLAGWAEKYPEVVVHRVVVRARPGPVLLEHSHRAQLVVVGSRGRGDLAGLLGSTSHALLHAAACPVAVVRPDLAG